VQAHAAGKHRAHEKQPGNHGKETNAQHAPLGESFAALERIIEHREHDRDE
jgi:hypothetical protein